jgi:hypothetical protein
LELREGWTYKDKCPKLQKKTDKNGSRNHSKKLDRQDGRGRGAGKSSSERGTRGQGRKPYRGKTRKIADNGISKKSATKYSHDSRNEAVNWVKIRQELRRDEIFSRKKLSEMLSNKMLNVGLIIRDAMYRTELQRCKECETDRQRHEIELDDALDEQAWEAARISKIARRVKPREDGSRGVIDSGATIHCTGGIRLFESLDMRYTRKLAIIKENQMITSKEIVRITLGGLYARI